MGMLMGLLGPLMSLFGGSGNQDAPQMQQGSAPAPYAGSTAVSKPPAEVSNVSSEGTGGGVGIVPSAPGGAPPGQEITGGTAIGDQPTSTSGEGFSGVAGSGLLDDGSLI